LLLLAFVFYPVCTAMTGDASMVMVGARGKDIYVAIVGANMEREALGLTNLWPKTHIDGIQVDEAQDIGTMTFKNSTDYFRELYDEANSETTNWAPYALGFDYFKLAVPSKGVPLCETGKLTPKNNMWCIAGDVRDDMKDFIPVLATRNLDCGSFYKALQSEGKKDVLFSKQYKTPFSNKAFVTIHKGGGIHKATGRYVNTIIYRYVAEGYPTLDDYPPAYLTPDSLVTRP